MQTNIKFNRHNVRNITTGAKCRVRYSLDNRADRRKVVTIYSKSILENLAPVFGQAENNTDSLTDYFESDRVRLFEDHPLYTQARAFVESIA